MIKITSPTRIDLAGGTLDMWPLYTFVGGACTINMAIDVQTSVCLEGIEGSRVEISCPEMKLEREYPHLAALLSEEDSELLLIREVLRHFRPGLGFRLETRSDSPVGGGLGGSSSLVVSLIKALHQYIHSDLKSPLDVALLAHNIEARILATPTGTQDYFPAISGGLNVIHYDLSGVRAEVFDVPKGMADHMTLVYTGHPHHSGLNNFEVLKAAVSKDAGCLGALGELAEIAWKFKETLFAGDWDELVPLFKRELDARRRLSPAFFSREIEQLEDLALSAGAQAVKICGAGGGGCVMIWSHPAQREQVREQCQKKGFRVLEANPVGPLPNWI